MQYNRHLSGIKINCDSLLLVCMGSAPLIVIFNSHDKIAKYLRKYTESFEIMDSVIRQFPFKEIKPNQNKGWVVISKDIKSKINLIANKIKGVAICLHMP